MPFGAFFINNNTVTQNWKRVVEKINVGESVVVFTKRELQAKGCRQIAKALLRQNVQTLKLTFCKISGEGGNVILQALMENKSLTTLNLRSNRLDSSVSATISNLLAHPNSALRDLNLEDNYIYTLGSIGNILRHSQSLIRLCISKNGIGPEGVVAIFESLGENKTLQKLEIGHNQVGIKGATVLCNVLRQNTTLCELDLGGCNIDTEGSVLVAEALGHNGSLRKLGLSCNRMDSISCENAFREALKHNKSLRELDLEGNNLQNSGVDAIMCGLRDNTSLRVLNLNCNGVYPAGADAIGELLLHNNCLQELSLRNNYVGDEGAKFISYGLLNNQALKKLELKRNKIGSEGVRALAEALLSNSTLKELHLGRNRISPQGAFFLAETLKRPECSLSTLRLGRNYLIQIGFMSIMRALRHNTSLGALALHKNGLAIDDNNGMEILDCLGLNTTLRELLCDCAEVDGFVQQEMKAILRRNNVIAEKRSIIMREDNLASGLWPWIIAKWPANVMFGIFREKPDPLLSNVATLPIFGEPGDFRNELETTKKQGFLAFLRKKDK